VDPRRDGAAPHDDTPVLAWTVVTGAAALRSTSALAERLSPSALDAGDGIHPLHHQAAFLGDTVPLATSQTAAGLAGTSASSATLITTCPPLDRKRWLILSRLLGSNAE
jgi:hypothetical protein